MIEQCARWRIRLPFLHHQREAPNGLLCGHEGEGHLIELILGELERRRPAQLPIAAPLAKTGKDLGTPALTDPIGEHDSRVEILRVAAARGPELVQVERLQLLAAKGLGHELALVPDLGLGIPLALPDAPVVRQEPMGDAVGVIDHLDAAGVGHGGNF